MARSAMPDDPLGCTCIDSPRPLGHGPACASSISKQAGPRMCKGQANAGPLLPHRDPARSQAPAGIGPQSGASQPRKVPAVNARFFCKGKPSGDHFIGPPPLG